MKFFIFNLVVLAFCSPAFADSFNNMSDVVSASEVLRSSDEVVREIETQIKSGFQYQGFIAYPSSSYCNCRKFVLIFKINDFNIPENSRGQYDSTVVKKLVEVKDYNSSKPHFKIFSMTSSLGL